MAEGIGSTPINQNNRMIVRSSCVDRKSKFVHSVLLKVVTKKDFKRKLTKACLNLELIAGKEIVAKVHF